MFQSTDVVRTKLKPDSSRSSSTSEPQLACDEIQQRLEARFPSCPAVRNLPQPDVSSCPWILDLITQQEAKKEPPVEPPSKEDLNAPQIDRLALIRGFIKELMESFRSPRPGWKPFGFEIVYFEPNLDTMFSSSKSNVPSVSEDEKGTGECPKDNVPLIDYLAPRSGVDRPTEAIRAVFHKSK